jgi:hypothetical protein
VTVDADYFRDCYAASPDPYGLAERWYEARKSTLRPATPAPATTCIKDWPRTPG